MSDAADTPPPTSRRARLRRRLKQYRRWLAITGATALVLAFLLVFDVAGALGDEAVTLGTGRAGLMTPDTVRIDSLARADSLLRADSLRRADSLARAERAADSVRRLQTPPSESRAAREIGGGEASYYSPSLRGRPTASGAPYDPDRLTAAHRTLPFGSKVRVTNLNNDRTVTVEITDRGPFVDRRVIDLSGAAARQLGMLSRGVARVKLELVTDE